MRAILRPDPIDYLVIGHIAQDLTKHGPQIGGTAAYGGLTAHALGLRVGIVTSWGEELSHDSLHFISIANCSTRQSTTFENVYQSGNRIQFIHHQAENLNGDFIPALWKNTPIVHLGPIAQEIDPMLVTKFKNSFVGLTPQGWMRAWDEEGRIYKSQWEQAVETLHQASAAVISVEDVKGNENDIEEMANVCSIFVATEGKRGARVFWNGDVRRVHAPQAEEVDATGAGDIFATAFFIQYHKTRDPWEAARFANQLAAQSVTRIGLSGVPTPEEIKSAIFEVL